jgi:homoserine acetyltransferase
LFFSFRHFEEKLKGVTGSGTAQAVLLQTARDWAREFDANSLITLMRAWASFDVEDELHKIRAKVFYVLADTDELFPASIGKAVMTNLLSAGIDATFLELKSRYGHYATTEEPEKWVPQAEKFLKRLAAASARP